MALSDAKIRALKPQSADFKTADGEGLYLLVKTTGAKWWRFAYRFEGRQKTLALGVYPKVSLLEARRARDAAKRQLQDGIDPSQDRKAERQEKSRAAKNTFEAIADEWFALKEGGWVESYSSRLRSRLDQDLIPSFGSRPINEIQPVEILQVLRTIEDRDAIEMAKRIKQMASQIFCYAVATGRCSSDPTASLKSALKPPKPVKHRAALPAKDLPTFMSQLAQYDGDDLTKLGLRLAIFTLLRTAELRFATWPEIENLDGREPLWRVPEERMKMRRAHLVPLSSQAVEALSELKKLTGKSEYLFPGPTKKGVVSENTFLFAIYRMGYHSRATTHGFRTTASTVLNEHQFNRDWIEMQLAHHDGTVRGIYNSAEWLSGRRQMLQWWGDFVEGKFAERKKRAA